jgi:hypothetical protein
VARRKLGACDPNRKRMLTLKKKDLQGGLFAQ